MQYVVFFPPRRQVRAARRLVQCELSDSTWSTMPKRGSTSDLGAKPTLIDGFTVRDVSLALMDLNTAVGFTRECDLITRERVKHWMAMPLDDLKTAARANKVKVSGMGGKKTIALQLAVFRKLPLDPTAQVPSAAAPSEREPKPSKSKVPVAGKGTKAKALDAPKKTIGKSSKAKV